MYWLKKTKGAISIFLCFVMVALIVLTGALVDGSRMRAAETEVKSALDTAALSQLANYSNILKELYGLFAIADNDSGYIKESVESMLNKDMLTGLGTPEEGSDRYYSEMLNFPGGDSGKLLDLFDYKIESVKVEPVYNLSESSVVRQQILEYMKYRAPKEIAGQVLDKLMAFKDLGEQSKILERKLDIDDRLKEARESQENLSDKAYEINSLARNNEILQKMSELKSKLIEAAAKEKGMEDKKDGEGIESYRRDMEAAAELREELVEYIDDKLIKNNAFADAKQAIYDIRDKSGQAVKLSEELEASIAQDSSSFAEAVRTDIKDRSKGIDAKVLRDREAEIEKCTEAYRRIRDLINEIDLPDMSSELSGALPDDMDSFTADRPGCGDIGEMLESIPRVNYYVEKELEAEEGSVDPRDFIDSMKKDMDKYCETQTEHIKKGDEGNKGKFPTSGLPSQGAVVNGIERIRDIFDSDKKLIEGFGQQTSQMFSYSFTPDYDGTWDFEKDAEFSGTVSGASKKALSMVDGLLSLMSSGLRGMRDELYIDEYVMGTFKNAVTSRLDQKGNTQFDLSGYKMDARKNTFFSDAEVEYILNGGSSQESNVAWTKGQILLLRWALNTIAIYCDPAKVSLALETATSLVGLTVLGVPVVQTLILFAWSFAESMIDVCMLMEGEEVPVFKTRDVWILGAQGVGKAAAGALAGRIADSLKGTFIKETKKLAEEAAAKTFDYTSGIVAEKIEKGALEEIDDIAGKIADSLTAAVGQKIDEALASALKPFENAVFFEAEKRRPELDRLGDSLEAAKNDIADSYEDSLDRLMLYVDDALYSALEKGFPAVEGLLDQSGYSSLIDRLHQKEEKYFEDLKNIGFDFLGKKEKELREKLDSEAGKITADIKKIIEAAKESLRQKVYKQINETLRNNFSIASPDLNESIKEIIKQKIESIRSAGHGKAGEMLESFFDKLGGKSRGSLFKSLSADADTSFTTKVNVKGSMLKMNYSDYLRILLLFMSPDKKIKRIQDLVQLNMAEETGNKYFRLSDFNTCLRVEADVSIRYFFLTLAVMPGRFRGRYHVSHVVYKGY